MNPSHPQTVGDTEPQVSAPEAGPDVAYWWWMGWGIASFVHYWESGEHDPQIEARWARATMRRFGARDWPTREQHKED